MSTNHSSQRRPSHMPLQVVYARFLSSEPFSYDVFTGFSSLRVLTYSASIPMIVHMLHFFESIECIFGYEGTLRGLYDILGCQKMICEHLATAIKGLEDERKRFILEQVHQGKIRFAVVKNAIAHSKIYLLEQATHRRVIVGSANWSLRAFAGEQAETITIFDQDDLAWEHYVHEYEAVQKQATNEIVPPTLESEQITLEDLPLFKEVRHAKIGVTVFVNREAIATSTPSLIHTVERLSEVYRAPVQSLIKSKGDQVHVTAETMGKIAHMVKSQRRTEPLYQEPDWLSIDRETHKVILTNKVISLAPNWTDVQSDVECLIEYFENFRMGFHGDIAQQQRDYFLFLCWFYFTPFVCDLRNQAIAEQDYIFDFPLFAVLYGRSNSGKTSLIQTLMRSMFGYFKFVDKMNFTQMKLRELLYTNKRFPAVFDDVDKQRFTEHASSLIKDELFVHPEYPAFVLSMNAAEEQSFPTEIRKRCLMLYAKASLPDYAGTGKTLYKSIQSIQRHISTALYSEYLRRMLEELARHPLQEDMLACSSQMVTAIFEEATSSPLPHWCHQVTVNDYQQKKYEKIRAELRKLYETNPSIWTLRRHEVVLTVQSAEAYGLRREIPDWVMKEGSKAGQIILDKKELEDFLHLSLRRSWWLRLLRGQEKPGATLKKY